MQEEKQLFGKCPVCKAIVSLDATRNVECDACSDENKDISKPIIVSAAGKYWRWQWVGAGHQNGYWYRQNDDGTESLYRTADLFEQLLVKLIEQLRSTAEC